MGRAKIGEVYFFNFLARARATIKSRNLRAGHFERARAPSPRAVAKGAQVSGKVLLNEVLSSRLNIRSFSVFASACRAAPGSFASPFSRLSLAPASPRLSFAFVFYLVSPVRPSRSGVFTVVH